MVARILLEEMVCYLAADDLLYSSMVMMSFPLRFANLWGRMLLLISLI